MADVNITGSPKPGRSPRFTSITLCRLQMEGLPGPPTSH
jgi:hypothetical protein